MNKEIIEHYKTLLFTYPDTTPVLKTYAIVDSARDETLTQTIALAGLRHTDLWHNELWKNKQSHPLYLVELEKQNGLLDSLLTKHKDSVSIYFISPYTLEALQSYYSTFTHVDLEIEVNDTQKALFGFYDPNIIENYINTLYTPDKVDEFFAGVGLWLSPDIEKEDALYFAFKAKDGTVSGTHLTLSQHKEKQPPTLDFDEISLPQRLQLESYAHNVSIDHRQVKMFDEVEKTKFIDDVFEWAKDDEYDIHHNMALKKEIAFRLFDEAKQLGLQSEISIYRYIVIVLLMQTPMQQTAFYKKLRQSPDENTRQGLLDQEIWTMLKHQRRMTHGR